MADNSRYGFGLDFYEGNSVRDWSLLKDWSLNPGFAYFRLGIGTHTDNPTLITQCSQQTNLLIGQFYEMWLPSVPKADQLAVIKAGISKLATLPLALAFEPEVEIDRKGNRVEGWPSVGDLQYLLANLPGSMVYTNQAGLDVIKTALGSIPGAWKFWYARYLDAATLEANVDDTLALLQGKYGITPDRILFMQTCRSGAYPQGFSFDRGADYDRLVSYAAPAPAPVPSGSMYQVTVTAPARLNVRQSADPASPIVGQLQSGDAVSGAPANGWLDLAGFASLQFLKPIGGIPSPAPAPAPVPPPPSIPAGNYYVILHDQQMPPDFLPRMLQPGSTLPQNVGFPETVNLEGSDPVVLTEPIQQFIFQLMRLAAPNMADADLRRAFTELLGAHLAFANGTGFPTRDTDEPRANFITGENLGAKPASLDRIRNTGGNVVLVPDETPVQVGGAECLKIATLNATSLPSTMDVNMIKTPWFVFRCTTVTPFKLADGRYRCNGFPQLGGLPVPFPLMTMTGYGFIEKARLVKVTNPFMVSPFIP